MILETETGANVPLIKVYPDKFSDHVVLVTGAAQGIGFATAQLFSDQGAHVILLDIQEEKLKQAISLIEARNGKSSYRICDITDEHSIQDAIDWVIRTFHKIDILANIAGIYPNSGICETTTELYRRTMSLNVDGSFFLTRAVLPHMRTAGYGRIIHTGSTTFQEPEQGQVAYVTSKAAIVGLVRATSIEAGPGITVNAVMPGLIKTEHVWKLVVQPDGSYPLFESVIKKQDVKRCGLPQDVAHVFCFVASPEASFISGQIFDVGGGATFH
ncbi:uncharacterized protein N7479_009982 [Penicillium vulpinum]|uniref:Ketoreductase domain-containing protein n=1 Tax=Penicillium vulpinum TaxID=29845 RepID=A0A1V6RBU1_9EURO|nr:uncharacterized protein N7479_009982 [Penicillium vulpinum]KAJ5951569.1 hypothetical protein N7479_009982 [Penicillium vulpinum]OQD99014.1 hypothetical protein PENVUL_c067G08409 [Penicillium vulpinum]